MFTPRTDLALEMKEDLEQKQGSMDGVHCEEEAVCGMQVIRIRVDNETGARNLGKPQGCYTTVRMHDVRTTQPDQLEELTDALAREIRALLPPRKADRHAILVTGLGNDDITPDALGPAVCRNTVVTRHLKAYMPEFFSDEGLEDVSVMTPGVLGQTGIESSDIIRGVVEKIKPRAVIAIDALMARSVDNLAKTVQIADTGITPGSGVKNARSSVDEKTLGIPVVSIGVATVVDAATLTADIMEQARAEGAYAASGDQVHTADAIRKALSPHEQNMIVTPKDIDRLITDAGKIIGFAINKAVHEGMKNSEIIQFLS